MADRIDNNNQEYMLDLLSAYLDGEVTDAEKALVEQALTTSPALQQELVQLRQTVDLVSALPSVAAPRPFTLSEADAQGVVPQGKRRGFWLPVWAGGLAMMAATLLCVFIAGGLFLTGGGNQASEIALLQDTASEAPKEESAAAEAAVVPAEAEKEVEKAITVEEVPEEDVAEEDVAEEDMAEGDMAEEDMAEFAAEAEEVLEEEAAAEEPELAGAVEAEESMNTAADDNAAASESEIELSQQVEVEEGVALAPGSPQPTQLPLFTATPMPLPTATPSPLATQPLVNTGGEAVTEMQESAPAPVAEADTSADAARSVDETLSATEAIQIAPTANLASTAPSAGEQKIADADTAAETDDALRDVVTGNQEIENIAPSEPLPEPTQPTTTYRQPVETQPQPDEQLQPAEATSEQVQAPSATNVSPQPESIEDNVLSEQVTQYGYLIGLIIVGLVLLLALIAVIMWVSKSR